MKKVKKLFGKTSQEILYSSTKYFDGEQKVNIIAKHNINFKTS